MSRYIQGTFARNTSIHSPGGKRAEEIDRKKKEEKQISHISGNANKWSQ